MPNCAPPTVVLGIGNTLMGDDAIGVHVVRRLITGGAKDPVPLRCLDVGTLSFTLAEVIEDAAQLIVVDAARMGENPGVVQVFQGTHLDRFLRVPRQSMHEVGLPDLFDMARLRGMLPALRAMVAVEPRRIAVGEEMTAEVVAAIPNAVNRVREIAAQWAAKKGPMQG